MVFSRRVVLTGAAAAPVLALLGRSAAQAQQSPLVRIIDGWGQARLAPDAVEVLAKIKGTVYALKPAELVAGQKTPTVRVPLPTGKFRPDFTELVGTVAGGIGLRTPDRDKRVRQLSGSLVAKRGKRESELTGKGAIILDDERAEFGPLTTTVLDEAVVTVEPGKPGKPATARVEAPVYATAEAVTLFTQYFGGSGLTQDMKVAQASAECRYWAPSKR
jgi:hypothetical protein